MKIYNQCKCGYLFGLSKIEPNVILFDKEKDIFRLKLNNQSWEIKYCPDCYGKYPTGDINEIKCKCGLKKQLLSKEFSDLVKMDDAILYIILRKVKIPHPDSNQADVEANIPFYLPNCFNCGNRFFNPNDMKTKGIEHIYLEEELEDLFEKLNEINSKQDASQLLGKPEDILGIGYWGQTKETVDYKHLIIQETHCYSNLCKTVSLQIDYYFDGEIGYQISALQ